MTQPPFILETELPGRRINIDTLRVIAHRYYWASQLIAGKSVLEVGCGPALGVGWLSRYAGSVFAGDIVAENLVLAKDHYGRKINFLRMDAHRLPFKNASIDVVLCVAAIIYLDAKSFFLECRRIIRKDGLLLLNTPNRDQPGFRPSSLSREYHSVPELYVLLDQCGFEVKMLGAFQVEISQIARRNPLLQHLIKIASRILKVINADQIIKRLIGYHTFVLGRELGECEMRLVEGVELKPIKSDIPDLKHRIVYIVAKPR